MLDDKAQGNDQSRKGNQAAEGGGRYGLRQADTVIVQQDHCNADSGGKSLILRQRGDEHAQSDECRPQNEKGQNRAVGGQQVHIAVLGEDQRVQANDGQRDQIYDQQGQILAQNDLRGSDGQRVEQLVGFLLTFFRNDAHGQNGDNDHENQTAKAQNELEVTDCRLQVIENGTDADEKQQKGAEHIGGQGAKVGPQLVFQYCNHASSTSLSCVSS